MTRLFSPAIWTVVLAASGVLLVLVPILHLALQIDATVKRVRPDDWRGVEPRERLIKQALFGILRDVAEVERIFLIIKAQKEY